MGNDKSMAKMSVMGKIRSFIADTAAEMKRCTWPSRRQLVESTVLVVFATLLLAIFVFGVDQLATWLIRLITVK